MIIPERDDSTFPGLTAIMSSLNAAVKDIDLVFVVWVDSDLGVAVTATHRKVF